MRPLFVTNGVAGHPSVRFSTARNLDIASSVNLDTGTGQTVFVIHTLQAGNTLLQKGDGNGLGTGEWRMTPSTYLLSSNGPSGLIDPDPLDARVIVGRYDGTTIEVFHNGTRVGQSNYSGSVMNTNGMSCVVVPKMV